MLGMNGFLGPEIELGEDLSTAQSTLESSGWQQVPAPPDAPTATMGWYRRDGEKRGDQLREGMLALDDDGVLIFGELFKSEREASLTKTAASIGLYKVLGKDQTLDER